MKDAVSFERLPETRGEATEKAPALVSWNDA